MLRSIHVFLAYLTVAGFVVRAVWSLSGSGLREQKLVKVLPHVVDTLLLVLGASWLELGVVMRSPRTWPRPPSCSHRELVRSEEARASEGAQTASASEGAQTPEDDDMRQTLSLIHI